MEMNFSLTDEEKKELLSSAEKSIKLSLVRRNPVWRWTIPSLSVPRGAFVTLSSDIA
jgi:hypothetical protein